MNHEAILQSWRSLDAAILSLKEVQLWDLLKFERNNQKRRLFMRRIFGRANKLRGERELKDFMKGSK